MAAIFVSFPVSADPLRVFVAASLGDVVKAAVSDWPEQVLISASGSGTIARQIDQGAPADVIMLANTDWMDWLEGRGHIIPESRSEPIGNRLVLVGPPGADDLSELTREAVLSRLGANGRLAIGEHRSVPAGQYAAQWLQTIGLWEDLRPRLAEVENVRAALALASRGEVPLAVIYASDLAAAPDAGSLVWDIPRVEQPEIRYSVAATQDRGVALAKFLSGPETVQIFTQFGFKGGAD